MSYVIFANTAESERFAADASRLGGKAAALAALCAADLPVPNWFVLTPEAFYDSLRDEQHHALALGSGHHDLTLPGEVIPSAAVRTQLEQALLRLCPRGEPVAVRSSAVEEDGVECSFAGQLDSFLWVEHEHVADAVAAVWRSAFAESALAYRRERGLHSSPQPPAVLIQRMVDADRAGVAFSADPVSGRRSIAVISAVYGLGIGLVSGEYDADTYEVDRSGHIPTRRIADKQSAYRRAVSGGVQRTAVAPPQATAPALDDEQIRAVAQLARRVESVFGRPQDIEWAIEGGTIYLLQSRPITTLASQPDPDGARALWDNSNISESYGGVTTPLTFSFARRAYEHVYRRFCSLMGVPQTVLEAHDSTFRRMIGLIRGRVYYNLLSWYRALALLPGFRVNRRFMEQMMGVREGLPEELAAELSAAGRGQRLRDGLRLLASCCKLIAHHLLLKRTVRRFYERLDTALGSQRPDLNRMRPDELVTYYRSLERSLLTRWDAPLINDFLAMIFYGVLRKLAAAWCGDTAGTLQNDLLCGEGGMISAEPAARVCEMAAVAAGSPELVAALCNGSLHEIRHALRQAPAFEQLYSSYIDTFGNRCLEELKLESATLRDDPLPLLRSVGSLARAIQSRNVPPSPVPGAQRDEATLRRQAEQRVRTALARHPLRRIIFGWVLKHARARVRDRENLRFERTRVFGQARAIFVELGRRLYALDLLDDARDIFYLELDELLGFVEGTATCADLRGLAAVRKAEFERYRREPAPPDRFETRGIPYAVDVPLLTPDLRISQSETHSLSDTTLSSPELETHTGLGCCPGVVRGRVRVIRNPRDAQLQQGEILVAERTDPGWIMLFPAAAGVLVERGSLLSHSAIVARELGIPTIISLSGVTRWLQDGDLVEMDGATGIVRKLAA